MPTRNKPTLISVLMGVRYRRETLTLLQRSVESVLNQSFADFEFLICENGSTDAAKEYLCSIERQDARVRLLSGDGADTLAAKLNRCIDAAQGDFFARQDDDDVSEAERFACQWDYLNIHPEVDFVGCAVRLEQDGVIVGTRLPPEAPTVKDFLFVQPFLHPTLMFRRDVFDNIRYDESKRCAYCEDYDLLLRLYERGCEGANLQKTLFTYHLPTTGTIHRTMAMRWDEARTRWLRFKSLELLPAAIPYVIKPVVVGLLPNKLLQRLKQLRGINCKEKNP